MNRQGSPSNFHNQVNNKSFHFRKSSVQQDQFQQMQDGGQYPSEPLPNQTSQKSGKHKIKMFLNKKCVSGFHKNLLQDQSRKPLPIVKLNKQKLPNLNNSSIGTFPSLLESQKHEILHHKSISDYEGGYTIQKNQVPSVEEFCSRQLNASSDKKQSTALFKQSKKLDRDNQRSSSNQTSTNFMTQVIYSRQSKQIQQESNQSSPLKGGQFVGVFKRNRKNNSVSQGTIFTCNQCCCQQKPLRTADQQIQTEVIVPVEANPGGPSLQILNHPQSLFDNFLKSYAENIKFQNYKTYAERELSQRTQQIKRHIEQNEKQNEKQKIRENEQDQQILEQKEKIYELVKIIQLHCPQQLKLCNLDLFKYIVEHKQYTRFITQQSNFTITKNSTYMPIEKSSQMDSIPNYNIDFLDDKQKERDDKLQQRSHTIINQYNGLKLNRDNTLNVPADTVKKQKTTDKDYDIKQNPYLKHKNSDDISIVAESITYDKNSNYSPGKCLNHEEVKEVDEDENESSQKQSLNNQNSINNNGLKTSFKNESSEKRNSEGKIQGARTIQTLLKQQTLTNLNRGKTLTKKETLTLRRRLLESQDYSKTRLNNDEDEIISLSCIVKIICAMKEEGNTTRKLFQEILYDYDDEKSRGLEFLLVKDFLRVIQEKAKQVKITNEEMEKLKSCYGYRYKDKIQIFDYTELEYIFDTLDESTLYSYQYRNVNLKTLDTKSYRLINRIRQFMEKNNIKSIREFAEYNQGCVIFIAQTPKKSVLSVNEDIFYLHLKQLGIKQTTKKHQTFIERFRVGRSKRKCLNLEEIEKFITLSKECRYIQLFTTQKRIPEMKSEEIIKPFKEEWGIIKEEDRSSDGFCSDLSNNIESDPIHEQ